MKLSTAICYLIGICFVGFAIFMCGLEYGYQQGYADCQVKYFQNINLPRGGIK